MANHQPSRDQLHEMVRESLLNDWDPIGVREYPQAADEYDSYVAGVCKLLTAGADAYKLRKHLAHIETVGMGLSAPCAHLDDVVQKLLSMVATARTSWETTPVQRYLFIFGYETPEQFKYNQESGTDDEDSFAFFLDAKDEHSALARGRSLASKFVERLYAKSGLTSPWSPEHYANWIEHRPLDRFSGMALETLPIVASSDAPDYDEWLDL